MKAVLTPLAALAALSLAACDQPKPRPAQPQAAAPPGAPAAAPAPAPPASAGLAKRPEMAGFSLDVINQAKDPLNTPATVKASDPVTFSGFGFDPVAKAPAAGVDIVIDGVAHPTAYGHRRQDVADYFKTPALENSGFTVTLPAVNAGQHQVVVRVVAVDRSGYFDSAAIGFVAK